MSPQIRLIPATPGACIFRRQVICKMSIARAKNTWQNVCDTFWRKRTEGVNDVATARVNACLNLTSGVEADCKALSSVGDGM